MYLSNDNFFFEEDDVDSYDSKIKVVDFYFF